MGGEHSSYFVEYKIPFTMLKDGEGNDYNGSEYIGFDVTIVDLDEEGTSNGAATETERQRINFSNPCIPLAAESWSTMAMSAIVELVWFHLTNYDDEEALDDINVLSTNIILNGTLAFNTEVSNIQVFNTIGQVVSTDNDVTNLKNGIYVVVVNANGETVANRFVKK